MNRFILVFDKGNLENILDFLYNKGYVPVQIMHSINVIIIEGEGDIINEVSSLKGVISIESERTIQL